MLNLNVNAPYLVYRHRLQSSSKSSQSLLFVSLVSFAQLKPAIVPVPVMTPGTAMGISNLENAFFPLLVGAIALLVIFDYSS
jgi:hypothetical protein